MLALMLLATSCAGDKKPSAEDASVNAAEKTSADSVAKQSDTKTVDAVSSATNVANAPTFNGLMMVSPQRNATVSLTMGGRIHTLSVMPGQSVRQGQVIATIENPEFIELQRSYLDASANIDWLYKEYERQKSLGSHDAASAKSVERSKAEYLSMKSTLMAAEASLKALGVNPSQLHAKGISPYLPVKAPLSGYVTNVKANLGKYLEAGAPVCDVIDKRQPLLQLTVYEKELSLMKVGLPMEFRVNGMGKKTFTATIVSIDQSVDAEDYSVKVYARVDSPNDEFRPGMYVRAKMRVNK